MLTKYYRGLEFSCLQDTGNPDVARDITQEAYARVLTMMAAGESIRNPFLLLHKIARNLVVDRYRHGETGGDFFGQEMLEKHPQGRVSAQTQPEAVYETREILAACAKVIAALPPRCREAFKLHVFEGASNIDIARRMGISVSMVEKYLMRGRAACDACRKGRKAPVSS